MKNQFVILVYNPRRWPPRLFLFEFLHGPFQIIFTDTGRIGYAYAKKLGDSCNMVVAVDVIGLVLYALFHVLSEVVKKRLPFTHAFSPFLHLECRDAVQHVAITRNFRHDKLVK